MTHLPDTRYKIQDILLSFCAYDYTHIRPNESFLFHIFLGILYLIKTESILFVSAICTQMKSA